MMSSRPVSVAALPEGPRDSASLQTLRLLRDAGSYLRELRESYGGIFTLRPLHSPAFVVVCDPALIGALFTGDPATLHAGAANRILEPASGPNAMLFLDEDEHLSRRRLLGPSFQDTNLQSYLGLIETLVQDELDSWPLDQPIALHTRFRDLATDVMLRVILGEDELGIWRELKADLLEIRRDASRHRARAQLGQFVVHARRVGGGTGGGQTRVVRALLNERGQSNEPVVDDAVVDELLALLVAGQETTAGTLAWAAERLCRDASLQRRLRAAFSDERDDDYVDAFISELLRVRPVLQWSVRQLTRPLPLRSWLLPESTVVAVSIYLVHHDPDLFPDPDRFLPDRFLGEQPSRAHSFVAFGGGTRRCVGGRLALLEIRTVLAQLLRRFALEPARGHERDERWRRSGITYVPAEGALVCLSVPARPSDEVTLGGCARSGRCPG
ncbi:MAG TPA: cytochrome P450 [Solirubrobacteraceae bacterium]|jgi:cytochrome P450|nr:cytochrome P450 [Solirubrobacteraceae bacterium]